MRNANIERVRILSMLMVLTMHALAKSGALYDSGATVYWWVEALCVCAVDVFVMITGYYSVTAPFRSERILRVLVIVWSWSLLNSLIVAVVMRQPLTPASIVRMLIPVLSKKYWFVNAWLGMMVLSPYVNLLVRSLTREQFRFLLGFLLLAMVLRPTLLPREWGQDDSMGLTMFFFLTLYVLAAWIRLYSNPAHLRLSWLWLGYLAFSLLILGSRALFLRLGTSDATAMHWYGYDSAPVVAQAVLLLLIGLNGKTISGRAAGVVSALAKNSFAVYIIHFSLNPILWTRVLHLGRWIGTPWKGILAVLAAVALVYLACIGVEELRLRFFRRLNRRLRLTQHLVPLLRRWNDTVSSL